jgi:hypothetical protein
MSNLDKGYFARRALEEAERAQAAADPKSREAHEKFQRAYAERASVGERSLVEDESA